MLEPEFWAFAERYIAIDTQPQSGNAAIESFVLEVTGPLSPRVSVQRAVHLGRPQVNVLCSFGPERPGGLLLVTHSDTVPAGPLHRWTEGAPLQLTRTGDGRLIGLGTVDVKLDYLCKAFALRRLGLERLRRPVHLLATWGEEMGLLGTKQFIASGELRPEWVLCGEPSELIPCHAHKGYAMTRVLASLGGDGAVLSGRFRLVAHGKAAHSSTPHLGENAIDKLFDDLLAARAPIVRAHGGSSSNTVPAEAEALLAHEVPGATPALEPALGPDLLPAVVALRAAWQAWTKLARELEPLRDETFSPPEAVCNFGTLQAEPGGLLASFDARLLPEHDPDALHARFAEALRAITPGGVSLSGSVERSARGMRADPESPLLAALSAAVRAEGLPGAPKPKGTSTEAGAYFHAGSDAAVFGPGVSVGNAHTANEWNRVRDLELATRIYERLISTLCA